MRVLVTGGCGFLGTNLVNSLVSDGHEVISMDNFQTSRTRESSASALVEHDICQPLPDLGDFDRVYHLACPASPPKYQSDPVKTVMTNVLGTKNVLDYAKMSGARFLLTSTSEIYGDPVSEFHPQPEHYRGNVKCYGPRACYDEGKRVAETLTYEYRNSVDTRVVRIFNTYGPHMDPDDGRVVSNFIKQALLSRDITVYGSGDQTRSLCYVDDMVRGLKAAMESDYTDPVNLGNTREMKVIEIAEMILGIVGSPSRIVSMPLPKDDPTQRRPDISLAKRVLGWSPEVSAEDGLVRTVEYFRGVV